MPRIPPFEKRVKRPPCQTFAKLRRYFFVSSTQSLKIMNTSSIFLIWDDDLVDTSEKSPWEHFLEVNISVFNLEFLPSRIWIFTISWKKVSKKNPFTCNIWEVNKTIEILRLLNTLFVGDEIVKWSKEYPSSKAIGADRMRKIFIFPCITFKDLQVLFGNYDRQTGS